MSTNDAAAPDNVAPIAAIVEAEADDYNGDADSALGVNEDGSSTTSVTDSVRAYRTENGRTYHAFREGKYFAPNDEEENDRLDLQHHIWNLTLSGALVSFPKPEKVFHQVLDMGTGTGIWANADFEVDFADEHPESQVTGVDLSPIQPKFVPPNCFFEVDDIEDPWMYSHKFDLIHARMMTGSIANWPKLFAQAFENLTPGGYIQLSDISARIYSDDNSLPLDAGIVKWVDHWAQATEKTGRSGVAPESYKSQLEEAGFVDVVQVAYKWPTNSWPTDRHHKMLGLWNYENMSQGMQSYSLALFTRILGWSVEELEVLLIDVRKEMKNPRIHAYYPIYAVYGRKPE